MERSSAACSRSEHLPNAPPARASRGLPYSQAMLEAGSPVPDVNVWTNIREQPRPLEEILGPGWSLLLFYLHDWSPT